MAFVWWFSVEVIGTVAGTLLAAPMPEGSTDI